MFFSFIVPFIPSFTKDHLTPFFDFWGLFCNVHQSKFHSSPAAPSMTSKDIDAHAAADAFFFSISTVRSHIIKISGSKLKKKNTTQLYTNTDI